MITALLALTYLLFGWRFDHLPIAVNQPEMRDAVQAWGLPVVMSDNPDIRWEPDTVGIGMGAQADPYDLSCGTDCQYNRVLHHCLIRVNMRFFEGLSPDRQRAIYIHEVGHCLGLMHDNIRPDSIMRSSSPASSTPTAFDLERIAVLYPQQPPPASPTASPTPSPTPLPVRVVIPMIAWDR